MKDTKKKVKKKDLDKVIDKVLAYNPKKKRRVITKADAKDKVDG